MTRRERTVSDRMDTRIEIPRERKEIYDFIDANPVMPEVERILAARRAEMERCCKDVCHLCRKYKAKDYGDGEFRHASPMGRILCEATAIRERWAGER